MKDFFTEADCDVLKCYSHDPSQLSISLAKANRLLRERGKVVFGENTYSDGWCENGDSQCTHTALLICVEPIEPDSLEKILRDLIETADSLPQKNPVMSIGFYIDRARKILNKGKE